MRAAPVTGPYFLLPVAHLAPLQQSVSGHHVLCQRRLQCRLPRPRQPALPGTSLLYCSDYHANHFKFYRVTLNSPWILDLYSIAQLEFERVVNCSDSR